MKRPSFSAVLLTVAVLGLAVFIAACGDAGGETVVTGLSTTGVTPMEEGPPTTADTTAGSSVPSTVSSTAPTVGQTSISDPEPQTTTVTTVTATSTGSTLGEPPTSSSILKPLKPPSTLIIVKPTNLTLQPVNTWRLYEETDPFLSWDGPWEQYSNPEASGGGYKSAFTDGRIGLTFTGQRVSLLCPKGPKNGIVRITLDYQQVATLDLYANPYGFPGVVWTSDALPNGAHVLQIVPTGTKNTHSGGYAWQFDAVKIYGKLLEYTQD